MKHLRILVSLAIIALLLFSAGCAPHGNNFKLVQEITGEKPAGFWLGLWHGIIFPITFIISLFNENVGVYEVYNAGKLYNLGFLLGLFGSIGGTAKNAASSKHKKV